MKKVSLIFIAALLVLTMLTGCTGSAPAKPSGGEGAPDASDATPEPVAEKWPKTAIQIVCTTSAGGGSDNQSRVLLPYLQEILGQTITIVNKPGADTELGTAEVMESKPDGYIIGVSGGSNISVVLADENNDITYDKIEPLAYFGMTPFAYVTKPNSPFKNLSEMIEYAKANPGKLTLAVSGASHKLLAYDFCEQAGVELTQVDFGSGGDSLNAVLGGHVDLASLSPAYFDRLLDAKCNLLAVCGEKRQDKYPEVETFLENDLTVEMASGIVFFGPKGLPENVIKAYSDAFEQIGQNEKVANTYIEGGLYSSYIYRVDDVLRKWLSTNVETIGNLTKKYMK